MRRHLIRMLGLAGMMFILASCQEVTLPGTSAPDLPDADVLIGEEYQSPACCDEVVVIAPARPPTCDPYTDVNWCQGSGGQCITSFSGVQMLGPSGCGDGGGGSTGTGGGGGYTGGSGSAPLPPPDALPPPNEGPGLFAACVGALAGVMIGTATMQPTAENLYEARNEYDSAKRMYAAVMANNPSLEMELLYAHRVEVARSSYNDAVLGYAVAGGATVGAVIAAVVVCSPGLILPTP